MTKRTRTGLVVVVAIAGALLGVVLWTTSHPPRATPKPPPEHLSVQQWLNSREAFQIELNDVLVEARQLTAPSPQATTVCQTLARVSRHLLNSGPAPKPLLDTAANVGISQFSQAAQACLAGDLALMRSRIDEGTTLRAEAQDTLDEILHGDHSGH